MRDELKAFGDALIANHDRHKPFEEKVINRINHVILLLHEELYMTDQITQAEADLATAVSNIASVVATQFDALKTEIAALQAAGGSTAALDAAAANIETQVTALNTLAATLNAPVPPAPPTPPLTVLTLTQGDISASVGAGFVAALTADGGTAPYTFDVVGLPAGVSADNAGNISGTVSTAGTTTVTVTITDSASPANTSQATFNIVVA